MTVQVSQNQFQTDLEAANAHFSRFRQFHRLVDSSISVGEAVLRGDYYFSRFSLDLIPVDSVEITDQFAQILREDASGFPSPELPPMNFGVPKSFAEGKDWLEAQLKSVCMTRHTVMQEELERVILAGGKRLRPSLALAAYGLGSGEPYPVLPLMVMIELMHSASLIHDDVVDRGMVRRSVPTINASRGDWFAVQSADFILGRAMELLKIYRGSGIDERLARVSEQMCIGELEQMEYLHRDITSEIYFSLIEKKTALFIEAAAFCGAVAGGADPDTVKALEKYGYHIGIAFQIKDDILDFTGSSIFGKDLGQDSKKGLKTLPAIIGLDNAQEIVMENSEMAIRSIEKLKNGVSKKALVKMAIQLEKREI